MVKKENKETINPQAKSNNDNNGIVKDAIDNSKEITKKTIKEDLVKIHSKIDLESIKLIDSEKDLATKKKGKLIKKIYPYWVYIIKNGQPIKNFGVREEDFNGIKLLIRTEKVNDETKVVFRELYPEPKFDQNIIDSNKQRLSKELNLLKQIEKELETELFEKGETNEYNYDLADVRLAILEKEVMLDSIKYGKTFRYIHNWVRDDGIPCLIYEFENNGLRLKKEVKEKSLFSEASEVKQIESLESRRDIDEHLKKKEDRDWKKIAYWFLAAFLFLIATYGVFELLDHNYERSNGELIKEVQAMTLSCDRTFNNVATKLASTNEPFIEALTKNTNINNDLMEQCFKDNLIENSKPTIKK